MLCGIDTESIPAIAVLMCVYLSITWLLYGGAALSRMRLPLQHGKGRKHKHHAKQPHKTSHEKNILKCTSPRDGTYWNFHPHCVLDLAPWNQEPRDPDLLEAAQVFVEWVSGPSAQRAAPINGYRAYDNSFPYDVPDSQVVEETGADPVKDEGNVPRLQFQVGPCVCGGCVGVECGKSVKSSLCF